MDEQTFQSMDIKQIEGSSLLQNKILMTCCLKLTVNFLMW